MAAFVCGIVAVALTYFVSKAVSRGESMTLCLVLTGMVVGALFQAFITMTKYVADPDDKLPSITYWLMGGLSSANLDDLPLLLVPVVIGLVPMLLFRYQLNALSFGDEEAAGAGREHAFRAGAVHCLRDAGHGGVGGRSGHDRLGGAGHSASGAHGRGDPTTGCCCPRRFCSAGCTC